MLLATVAGALLVTDEVVLDVGRGARRFGKAAARCAMAALLPLLAGCDYAPLPSHDAVPERLLDGTLLRQLGSGVEAQKRQALEELRYIAWYYNAGGPSRPDEKVKPVIATLRGMLRNREEPLRVEAIDVLLWLSSPANDGSQNQSVGEALPELIAIASDVRQDEQLRGHAIDAMRWLGSDGVPALANLLFEQSASLQLRLLAARALKNSEAGRRELRRAVDTPGLDALVRGAALEGVCEGGGPECVPLAGHADPKVRLTAAGALAGTSSDPPHLAELGAALRDPKRTSQALLAIESLGARGASVLAEALESPDPGLRLIAARSLGRLRGAAKGAVPALRRAQENGSEPLRSAAAQALEQIGPSLREIAAGLVAPGPERARAFSDLSSAARRMGEYGAEVIPDLRRALKDPDARVRAQAASVLGDFEVPQAPASWTSVPPASPRGLFKAAARDAMPDLIAALHDQDATVRGNAALAFQVLLPSQEPRVASDPAVQALVDTLEDAETSVRRDALQALGMLAINRRLAAEDNEEAQLVMGALRRALQDENQEVRSMAAHWLKQATTASHR
jgi:HEAT repeat protein